MLDLIVSVPDHCLSLYCTNKERQAIKKFSFEHHCSVHFVSTEVNKCHKINNWTLLFALNVFLSEGRNFADNKISI